MKKTIIGLMFVGLAMASPVTVTFIGTGGVSDGADYVAPYYLLVGGVTVPVDCYSDLAAVTVGEAWEANQSTLAEAVSGGMFAGNQVGYEMVGVLSTLPTFSANDQIQLQHAIWDIFDNRYPVTGEMQAYMDTASSEIPTFDFSGVEFLEPIIGGPQPFVVASGVPEPASVGLIGLGLLAIGAMRRKVAKP